MPHVKLWDGATTRTLPEYVDATPEVPQKAGRWYGPPGLTANALLLVSNRVYLWPIVIPRRSLTAALGVHVTGPGSAGSVLRYAIYADNDGSPGAVEVDAGTVAAEATTWAPVPVATVLDPGVHWLAVVGQGAPATQPTVRAVSGFRNPLVGLVNPANIGAPGYYGSATQSGALATLGGVVDAPVAPSVLLSLA